MNQTLLESIRDLALEVAQETGVHVQDLDCHGGLLRIFIESDTGVTVDTCARFSGLMSQRLDQSNLILERYRLEVSSPGLERNLQGIEDFRRFPGRLAHIVTAQGAVDGTILRIEDESVVIASRDRLGQPQERVITIADVRRANLKITDQELLARPQPETHYSCVVEERR
jgi:ribosome maturation factor RimP